MSELNHVKRYWNSEAPIKCDVCKQPIRSIFQDSILAGGSWAISCPTCFRNYGNGLGIDRGQQYERQADGRWLKISG